MPALNVQLSAIIALPPVCRKENLQRMAHCIQLDMECAVICYHAAQLMSLGSDRAEEFCRTCTQMCIACANECDQHDNEHCRECAKACRRCAEICADMVELV